MPTTANQDRVAKASTSSNVEPPNLYGLKKTHKDMAPGQEEAGPPVRPVFGVMEAPNARLSSFLSRVIRDYVEVVTNHCKVKSSEEMRSNPSLMNLIEVCRLG